MVKQPNPNQAEVSGFRPLMLRFSIALSNQTFPFADPAALNPMTTPPPRTDRTPSRPHVARQPWDWPKRRHSYRGGRRRGCYFFEEFRRLSHGSLLKKIAQRQSGPGAAMINFPFGQD